MNRTFSSLLRAVFPLVVVGLGILLARATVRAQLGAPKLTMMTETSVYENSGTVKVHVMLMNPPATGTVTVQYATADGSATAPGDYTAILTGTLTFPQGTISQPIEVSIKSDSTPESDEHFFINLSEPVNAEIEQGKGSCKVIIKEMGGPPPPLTVQFSQAGYSKSEGGGSATITVQLSAVPTQTVTVQYATADGPPPSGATSGSDYQSASGTLTFAPPQGGQPGQTSKTFTVTILQDCRVEGNEIVQLQLSSPTNATLGSPSMASLIIEEDDIAPAVIVTATGGTFSPDPAPIDTWVSATLSAQALRPNPGPGCTLNSPTWNWTFVKAEYSDISDVGPWTEAASGYFYQIGTLGAPPPDSSHDYSAVSLSASFSDGAYWRITVSAAISYTNCCGQSFAGAAQTDAKGTGVKVISLTVTSGATQKNVTGASKNWAAIKKADTKVLIKATLKPDTDAAATAVTWTGGAAVANQPRMRSVDKGTSAKTNVKAAAGSSSKDLDIWIIWATISIQVADDPPNPPYKHKLGVIYTPDEKTAKSAAGEICAVATITPAGINAVVKDGWDMNREIQRHNFRDGEKYPGKYDADDEWPDDSSEPEFKFTTPDSADKLYDSDGPTIGLATAIDSIEINFNAKQYVMWNDEECSDRDAAAARWYWRARWKITQTPQVESAQVGLGHIDLSLYTKAEYKKP